MRIWTADQAQKATGGKLLGTQEWETFSISIDSRTTKRGDLFIALRGTKTDGHDYIREAFLKGAAAVMVERMPQNFPGSSPILLVDDCISALYKLAEHRRRESQAKIIAVTGSVGKTSTKEMLNIIFSNFGITHFSAGNNNNEIGVPLSLAKMPLNAEYGIFEIGMNHPGEISPLSILVRPDVAIITAIAEAHIEFFDSIEQIADEKAEIFQGLVQGGTAVINKDTEFFSKLSKIAKNQKSAEVISFGEDLMSDVRLVNHESSATGTLVHAKARTDEMDYRLSVRGKHMALNSLAALGAVMALNKNVKSAAEALSTFSAQKGRGQISHVDIGGGRVTIIDETYNASPVAMRAAISNLGDIMTGGRKIAILGDMLELGEKSIQMHESLATDILHNNVDLVFTVGEHSKHLFEILPQKIRGFAANDVDELLPQLADKISAGDAVLIKASNGTGLSRVVDELSRSKELA